MPPLTDSTDRSANEQITATYEDVPYENASYLQSHIDRLAASALLCGMKPAPVDRCRALEIGCASGGNLAPMADEFAASEFVGIDLSPRSIAAAGRLAAGAGLKNLRFEVRDLTQLPADFGVFDYIIAHGVYSWIPGELQPKMLAMISRHLSPRGVAYISYNVYPGWHAHQMMRDMMLYHARGASTHRAVVAGARQFVNILAATAPGGDVNSAAAFVRQDAQFIQSQPDAYIAHDHLSVYNNPVYFHQFVASLHEHHLTWLREATANLLRASQAAEARRLFPSIAEDWIAAEQYGDFLRAEQFRSSIAVHDDQAFTRDPGPAAVEPLHLRSRVTVEPGQPLVVTATGIPFKTPENLVVNIKDPHTQAILLALCKAWPMTLSFAEIIEAVRAQLHGDDPGFATPGTPQRLLLTRILLYGINCGLFAACSARAKLTTTVPPKPIASPLARYQARANLNITNRLHNPAAGITGVDRVLISHLNGARDRAALEGVLRAAVAQGILSDPAAADAAAAGWQGPIGQTLDARLATYAANALLIDDS